MRGFLKIIVAFSFVAIFSISAFADKEKVQKRGKIVSMEENTNTGVLLSEDGTCYEFEYHGAVMIQEGDDVIYMQITRGKKGGTIDIIRSVKN